MTEQANPPAHTSGFVSILGRPNSGKSTLLNALVGTKVAITADKPQTTRTSIQGVMTVPDSQVVFIDTPGILKSNTPIHKRMMESVRAALDERDLLLYVADATAPFVKADREALQLLSHSGAPTILVLNKRDLVKTPATLLPLIDQYRQLHEFAEVFPVSALRNQGLDELKKAILERLPEGPQYFPEDHVTDQPERFLATELIREKILRETQEEVPHSVLVLIDQWEDTPRLTRIVATAYVERDGQKGILIGSRGSMIKRIGTQAREEMELLFDRHIHLDLHVKVRPNWRENPTFLNALDWRTMRGQDDA